MLTKLSTYPDLQNHFNQIASCHIQDWFLQDPKRFTHFSLEMDGLLLDFSKNRLTQKTLDLLVALAREAKLEEKIAAFFAGDKINQTENRAVLHTALRAGKNSPQNVQDALIKMTGFVEKIRQQAWLGATQKPITDIVNVGIGGSHLGPQMTTQALKAFADPKLRCHFISNVDKHHVHSVLAGLNPETTLFIISSKSFNTIETLTNSNMIIDWLKKHLGNNIAPHLAAVTASAEKAKQLGIPDAQIFPIWDWVGGRYSIWSAIGLPLAILIGMENFQAFLNGGHAVDTHFKNTPFEKNLPVIMAMLGIWYNNFFKTNAHVVLPYADELTLFPAYLQQLDMESNGKQVCLDGNPVDYATGPMIFGDQGCNGQHSFYQWLHQSPNFIPLDFIVAGKEDDVLMASALSQAQAFMVGKPYDKAREDTSEFLAKHKTIPGNRPSNVIFLEKISPYHLGQLIALYEQKVFVQGAVLGINSFDQWGVELGKALLPPILNDLNGKTISESHDPSTRGLISHYKKLIGRS